MAKQKITLHPPPPPNKDIVVSFSLGFDAFNEIELLIDTTKVKMRRQTRGNARFLKRDIYEHLLLKGVKTFNAETFISEMIKKEGDGKKEL